MKKMGPKRAGNSRGITLVELMFTVFILTVGILSSLMYFVTAISASELARDTTVATTHGEYILEDMKTRVTLANIVAQDWQAFANGAGLNTLPQEAVAVTYANPTADPLNITTSVSWVRKSRANTVSLVTELTK